MFRSPTGTTTWQSLVVSVTADPGFNASLMIFRTSAVAAMIFKLSNFAAHASHCSAVQVARTQQCSQPLQAAMANPRVSKLSAMFQNAACRMGGQRWLICSSRARLGTSTKCPVAARTLHLLICKSCQASVLILRDRTNNPNPRHKRDLTESPDVPLRASTCLWSLPMHA